MLAAAISLGAICAAAALASQSSPPALKSPRAGGRVHVGNVRLVVQDPGLVGHERPVYVAIGPTKKRVRRLAALLGAAGCGPRCDYIALHPWKHHPGKWIVVAKAPRDGWTRIPGRYFMEAEHVSPPALCGQHGCEIRSAIRSFRVVR